LLNNRFSNDIALKRMTPFSLASVFFKRTIEFQTPVMGGRGPGKRNFCGNPGDFLREPDQAARAAKPACAQADTSSASRSRVASSSVSDTGGLASCSR